MLYQASLATPRDLAWFLASYAREAKFRIETGELPALAGIRAADRRRSRHPRGASLR